MTTFSDIYIYWFYSEIKIETAEMYVEKHINKSVDI